VARKGWEEWGFGTRLVHTGICDPVPDARPTSTPISQSATYIHPSAEALDQAFLDGSPVYSRRGNPTVQSFEAAIAAAENGAGAVAFGSGMAALHAAILAACTPRGETTPRLGRILASQDLYGATRTLLSAFFGSLGAETTFCDMTDLPEAERAMEAVQPDVIVLEPLSNPLLRVIDVAAIARTARAIGARLVVDSTFATPVLLRALELDAHFIVHSATKYLGGHGDAVGGVVVAAKQRQLDLLEHYARLLGGLLGPLDARLIARGMQTLVLRVRQQCANALYIAQWLQHQPQIAYVHYPGLTDHPHHPIAAQQFGGLGGGIVAFDLVGGDQAMSYHFMDALHLILPAMSLGDVTSLISYPITSSHRDVSAVEREQQGIGVGLLRLSVGIEDVQDIVRDLRRGLAAIGDVTTSSGDASTCTEHVTPASST
jgi:cystathionine gamma-synthase